MAEPRRCAIDNGSPNVTMEMRVGQLRVTLAHLTSRVPTLGPDLLGIEAPETM
ncbi:hypothetical protein SUDANB95_02252 [Actinosynnema sp. ALI-1.44]